MRFVSSIRQPARLCNTHVPRVSRGTSSHANVYAPDAIIDTIGNIAGGMHMKKTYEKPTLNKRQKLSSITADCTPSTCVN